MSNSKTSRTPVIKSKTNNKTNTSKTTSSKTKTNTNRSQTSVENAVKILKTAINKNISVSQAATQWKFGRNYISDLKSRVADNYKAKKVSKDTYNEFRNLVKEYSKK